MVIKCCLQYYKKNVAPTKYIWQIRMVTRMRTCNLTINLISFTYFVGRQLQAGDLKSSHIFVNYTMSPGKIV